MKRKITTIVILIMVFLGYDLNAQNNPPVAINDTLIPVFNINSSDTTLIIHVLENDFDPDGDPFKIFEVKNRAGQESTAISFSDSSITLTMPIMNLMEQVYDYRICKVNDTTSISNYALLYLNPSLDPDYPVAHNDTVIGIRGYPVSVNVLKNDYHPLGDSMFAYVGGFLPDSVLIIDCPTYTNEDYLIRNYFISDTSVMFQKFDRGLIYVKLLNSEWYDSLDINNINARFNCFGMHFWDLDGIQHFKVPNGSEVSSIFSQSLWIGGLDDGGTLHLAAETYRQNGIDFWSGPVSNNYDSIYDQKWLHVWNLQRNEIEYHNTHWQEPGYEPIHDILTWPGNGDVELGQSEFIAPFEDKNENGIYEALLGDAPQIRGGQALFFIYNDYRNAHTETGGIPLGVEIRAMAYAFDQPEDSTLWNTIFIHYDIQNLSDTAYHNLFLGVFTDTDLGNATDDRIECDVEAGMYFSYNGNEIDPGSSAYGEHPPAQGVLFLGGPTLENDGIDNPKYDALGQQIVDESINGLNFGDGIIDNERMGMTNFIYYNNSGGIGSNPNGAVEMYLYLQNFWADNSKVQYGGFGHPNYGAVGPDCNFMFPRDTDPYNWGTNGLIPNGGYNQNGLYWTEEQVNANPADRRGLGSSGPFMLLPGQTQSLDIALPWARDFEGTAWSSAELLKERAAYLKEKFQNDPDFFSRIEQNQLNDKTVLVYPNPVINELKVRLPELGNCKNLTVYSLLGAKQLELNLNGDENELKLDCSSMPPGIYILQLTAESQNFRTKFIKK